MTSERRRTWNQQVLLLLARPTVAAVALPIAALFGFLGQVDSESGAPGAVNLAAGIGAAALVSLAMLTLREENAIAMARTMGLVRRFPFPFFAAECTSASDVEKLRRRWNPVALPSMLLALAIALTCAALALDDDVLRAGTIELYQGDTVEHWQAAASTDARLKEHLGVRATLVGVARAGDGAYVARVRFTELHGQRTATVDLRSGESVRVRGHRLGLAGLVQGDRPGRAHLRLVSTDQEDVRVTVTVGTRRDLPGDLAVTIPSASWARLGSLGPATHVIIEQAGAVVRDTWAYLDAEGFDARHAVGGPVVVLEGIEPSTGVVLSVTRAGSAPRMTLAGTLTIVPALLLLLLLLRPRILLRGRDGDATVLVVGGRLRAEDAAAALLPAVLAKELQLLRDDGANPEERT